MLLKFDGHQQLTPASDPPRGNLKLILPLRDDEPSKNVEMDWFASIIYAQGQPCKRRCFSLPLPIAVWRIDSTDGIGASLESVPRVIASLLNWNSPNLTIQTVHEIQALGYPNIEIIIVDNASTDDSVACFQSELPGVRLIQSPFNEGFASGHAHAMEVALVENADLIWLLNTDVQLYPETLDALIQAYEQYGELHIYGSVPILPIDDGGRTRHRVIRPTKYFRVPYKEVVIPREAFRFYDELFPTTEPRQVGALTGASLLIPMKVIRQIGFLDTRFFMYTEVTDYCRRLYAEGVPSLIVPNSLIIHRQRGTYLNNRAVHDMIVYYRIRNQLLLIRRYENGWVFAKALLKDVLLIGHDIWKNKGEALPRVGYTLHGMWDGIWGRDGKTLAPENVVNHQD